MLTDYFSCYKLNNKAISLPQREKLTKLKDCQIFNVIKVLGIQILVFIKFKFKKIMFFLLAFGKS